MSHPDSVTIWAAPIFVAIPPVPRSEQASPAKASISFVISSTVSMRRASGFLFGSAVNSPSISDMRMRISASIVFAIIAPSVSLSPTLLISVVATVSFSLTTGRAPNLRRVFIVFSKFVLRSGFSISSPVIRIWPTV